MTAPIAQDLHHLGLVGVHTDVIRATTFQRPNNTTQYAANDVVSTTNGQHGEFDNAARYANGTGMIVEASVFVSENQGTKPTLQLLIFDEALAQADPTNDNAALALTDVDARKCIAVIDLDKIHVLNATSGAGGAILCAAKNLVVPFKCKNDGVKLYYLLVEAGTYTPAGDATFEVSIKVLKD